jgi:protein-S-isoprenylcysteine O-methyltransferase Ste14
VSANSTLERYRVVFTKGFLIIVGIGLLFLGSKWEQHMLLSSIFLIAAFFISGVAALGRLWCALYISGYKDHVLVRTGPYAICRNPLYFFSLIGAVGVALATKTVTVPIAVLLLFLLYYPSVIKSEEMRLAEIHKENFAEYCRETPAFFPKWSALIEPEEYLVRPKIFRKNLLDAIWFIWLVGILELINALRMIGIIPTLFSVY